MSEEKKQYVDNAGLRKALWPTGNIAPCARTIDRLRSRGLIPFIRLGALIFYDPDDVRRAISERLTIQPRGRSARKAA